MQHQAELEWNATPRINHPTMTAEIHPAVQDADNMN